MDDTIMPTKSPAHMDDRYQISDAHHCERLLTDSFRLVVLGK